MATSHDEYFTVTRVTPEQLEKQLDTIAKNIETVRKRVGPQATVKAANRILTTAVGVTTKRVHSEIGKPEVKQRHIRNRIRTSNMNLKHPRGQITAYIQDMPAIHLGYIKKASKPPKATAYHVQKRSAKIPGKRARARGAKGKPMGVKVGTKIFNDAYVQKTRGDKGGVYQVLDRRGKKTWKDGRSGWGYPKGGAPRDARNPQFVIKYSFKKAFEKHFIPSVEFVIARDFSKEFDAAEKNQIRLMFGTKRL